MNYEDGTPIKPGDIIRIDEKYIGRIIASMDTGQYLPGEEGWSYLGKGIMVDTDFAGLVHYTEDARDEFVFLRNDMRPGRLDDIHPSTR